MGGPEFHLPLSFFSMHLALFIVKGMFHLVHVCPSTFKCAPVCSYICMCVQICACMCMCEFNVYTFVCVPVCICVYRCVGVYECVWVCVHMSVCVCTCGFVHTYSSSSLHFLSFEAPVDTRESKKLSGFAPEFRAILLAAHLPEPQSPHLLCTPAFCIVPEIVMHP